MVSKYSLEKIPVEVEMDWGRDVPWSSGTNGRVCGGIPRSELCPLIYLGDERMALHYQQSLLKNWETALSTKSTRVCLLRLLDQKAVTQVRLQRRRLGQKRCS